LAGVRANRLAIMPTVIRTMSCQPVPVPLLDGVVVSVGGGVMRGVPVSASTLPDGELEGLLLGEELGDELGEELGLLLGEALGLSLGLLLGDSLGGMDSLWTGVLSLGEALGLSLGGVLSLGGTDSLCTGVLSLGEGDGVPWQPWLIVRTSLPLPCSPVQVTYAPVGAVSNHGEMMCQLPAPFSVPVYVWPLRWSTTGDDESPVKIQRTSPGLVSPEVHPLAMG
jgi:hypothetical protein